MYPGVFSFKGSLLTSILLYDLVRIVSGHHSVPELYINHKLNQNYHRPELTRNELKLEWVNLSKRGGMTGFSEGWQSCSKGIFRGRSQSEILWSSPVGPKKTLSFLTLFIRLTFFLKKFFIVTRRYGPLRGPTSSSCGGFFSPSGKKRAYYAVLAHFWQFLVSSSNLGNFQ